MNYIKLVSNVKKFTKRKVGHSNEPPVQPKFEMELDETPIEIGEKSPDKMLKDFDPSPNARIMNKIEYFFKPYSLKVQRAKHMHFENEKNLFIEKQIQHILQNDCDMPECEKREIIQYLETLRKEELDEMSKKGWQKMQRVLSRKDGLDFIDRMKAVGRK